MIAAVMAAWQALGWTGVLGMARSKVSGPLAGAIAATVVVAALVIGVLWIRADARRIVEAKCEADRLAAEVAAAAVREEGLKKALRIRIEEGKRLAGQAEQADQEVQRLIAERDELREKSHAAGSARHCLPADDPWLQNNGGAGKAAKSGGGRAGARPLP